MSLLRFAYTCARAAAIVVVLAPMAHAEDIYVPAGGDLQAALNAAQPGDTVLLAAGATYVGNFKLRNHGGASYITVRTNTPDALLPPAGARISPAYAPYLARIKSSTTTAALSTAPGAAFWRIMLVEFCPNQKNMGDIVALGDGSSNQSSLSQVPHHLILDRVYIHGDRLHGQKRGIGLNSAHTTIVNSYISEIKAVGQDTQSIAGWNGPGPFHIENNYFDGGTEVFLLGGDDPKIPGLVPSDLLFRGNYLTRPVAWRDPIMPTPSDVSATPGAGGSLAAGTYAYRVVARRPVSTTWATSARSAEVSATVAASGTVTIRWNAVADATEYRVYGRTPGGQTMYWKVTGTAFTDTGAAGTAGTPPASGTVWQIKNIFELKNARNAQVDFNVMENNWKQAQSGMAVLFTVRNSYGTCTWCVVEDVNFEYNVVRHTGGGVHVLGYDNTDPTQQTNAIRIRHNEFSDVDKSWGGSGYVFLLVDGPRDITIDHNTMVMGSGGGIVIVDGLPVDDFVFTNNVARHSSYGIFGAGTGFGNNAINHYFPNGVIQRNVMAGGKASVYPPDNLFPTQADFESRFVDYAGADYALKHGTDWAGAGLDGNDLGADYTQLRSPRTPQPVEPPRIVTESLAPTVELDAYHETLEAAGGRSPYRWRVLAGSLPAGMTLDPLAGIISGAAADEGDYTFTVEVTDAEGATASRPLMLHVERAIPPVEIATGSLAAAIATVPYSQHFEAVGGLGSYVWSLSAGTLPPGMSLTASGHLAGTTAATGTWVFTVTARDAQDASRQAQRAFELAVAPPPNKAPSVALTTDATGTVAVGAPVMLTAETADVDGFVQTVEFFVNGQRVGTVYSAPFTFVWAALDGGPHRISARAFDDDGEPGTSNEVEVTTKTEIVMHAADVTRMVGNFQLVADETAASGQRLWNRNKNAAKLAASAAPANYAEFTFYAEAGRAYHIWMRGKAEGNSWANDSILIQFSGTVDAGGAPIYRIGTTSAGWYSLEEDSNMGVAEWGWQDNGFGLNVLGATLYFEHTGVQTLRLQQREDGLSLDQIVISPANYLAASPGLSKNDTTIVTK